MFLRTTTMPPTGIAGRLCDLTGLYNRHVTSLQPLLLSQLSCNRPVTFLQPYEVTQGCTTPVGGTYVNSGWYRYFTALFPIAS